MHFYLKFLVKFKISAVLFRENFNVNLFLLKQKIADVHFYLKQ